MNARAQLAALPTFTPDLLAFLAAHRVYLEIGTSFAMGSGWLRFNDDEGGWEARIFNGARYVRLDEDTLYPTLPEALEAMRARWMQ